MTTTSTTASNSASVTPEAQATALWLFIESKTPRFSYEDALGVIRELQPRSGEDPKSLAKRLRKALQARRVALKHTHALHAASQVQGHSSWHTNEEADVARLQLTSMETVGTGIPLRIVEFASWSELAGELCAWADRLLARSELPLGVMALHVSGHALNFTAPRPADPGNERIQSQSWPLGTITPLLDKDGWLLDAPPALEKLRRHLEETGKVVLDGHAVLHLCANSRDRAGEPMSVTMADVPNSELVLQREDDEDAPRSGYEIARGNEVTCWHQLELSMRNDTSGVMPELDISVPVEGSGCWWVNGRRYVWVLETLKPKEYVPGRVTRFLGIDDCERLLRRYILAKRIHGNTFKYHEQTKSIDYLSGIPETYRVDQHFLLRQLKAADLTWESYCDKFGTEVLPMQEPLPVGFVFQLLQNLKVEKPNLMFAKPNLSEMERIDDDGLLRALMPRVHSVRSGVLPPGLEEERVKELHKTLEDFGSNLRVWMMMSGGALQTENELPYLLYASEAEQLRATVEELQLTMYAAVMPNLISTKGLLPDSANAWPWAPGYALFVRFERNGEVQ